MEKMSDKQEKVIDIIVDNSLVIPEYMIDFQNKSKKTIEKIESIKKLKNLEDLKNEAKNIDLDKSIKKNNFKKKKFYKKAYYKKKYYKKTKSSPLLERKV